MSGSLDPDQPGFSSRRREHERGTPSDEDLGQSFAFYHASFVALFGRAMEERLLGHNARALENLNSAETLLDGWPGVTDRYKIQIELERCAAHIGLASYGPATAALHSHFYLQRSLRAPLDPGITAYASMLEAVCYLKNGAAQDDVSQNQPFAAAAIARGLDALQKVSPLNSVDARYVPLAHMIAANYYRDTHQRMRALESIANAEMNARKIFGESHLMTSVTEVARADIMRDHGKYKLAARLYTSALEDRLDDKYPSSALTFAARVGLAWSKFQLGKYETAERHLLEAAEPLGSIYEVPTDALSNFVFITAYAFPTSEKPEVLVRLHDLADEVCLRQTGSAVPAEYAVLLERTDALMAVGKHEEAHLICERAIRALKAAGSNNQVDWLDVQERRFALAILIDNSEIAHDSSKAILRLSRPSFKSPEKSYMLAHAHHSAALGAFLAAQHLEALHHLDEGIKLLHGTEKHSELVRIELNSLAGNIFSDLGAFNLAVPFFTQVEELSRKVDRVHTIEYHYALLGLARARLELGDHQGCLEYINRASRWHDEFAEGTDNAQLFKAEADLFYGAVLAERGQKLELAGQFLLSAVTELTHVYTPGKHPLAEPYRRLGDYYRAAGFAQAAIDAYTDAEGCCSSCAIFSSTRRAVNQSLAELYSSDDPGMARVFASRAARIAQRNAIVVREQELTE